MSREMQEQSKEQDETRQRRMLSDIELQMLARGIDV